MTRIPTHTPTRTPSSKKEALASLAQRSGIANEYYDIWGTRHLTTDATRKALLEAMGFPSDIDPAQLLRQEEEREWRRSLPPVLVKRLGEAVAVPISLPATLANRRHQWILTAENGSVSSDTFIPAELGSLGERRLGKRNFVRNELLLSPPAEIGYYRLELEEHGREAERQAALTLIVAPSRGYAPEALKAEQRAWGLGVQFYGLRSTHNWGIGDFSDLRTLVDQAADAGAGVVGINPLHALFPDNPESASPYSPSSRCFINTLYLDVERVPEFVECEAARELVNSERFQARLRRLRTQDEVDYAQVAATKREVLELIYRHFRDTHMQHDSHRARAFRQFRDQGDAALEYHARFEALQEHFRQADPAIWGWPAWPETYRRPDLPAVEKFAAEHRETVEFFGWLQWLADEQLGAVGLQSWRRGLGLGLYQDLALGANPAGSECWTYQDTFANGAYAGAPPDEFNPLGQDWGLPPFIPHRLHDAAYAPFIAMLRANMRHCGALRIDHAMGLARIYWVPAGTDAGRTTAGAYVSYPLDDLLGIVALESERNHCLVIGEDLGTVPDGFRPRLEADGILAYHPFFFERTDNGDFKAPAEYPTQALVAVSTHDLPTLNGFWQNHDLDLRQRLNLFPSDEQRNRQLLDRAQDHARLLMALESEDLLPEGVGIHPVAVPEITTELMLAVHTYLARTPAQLLLVQPEDVLGLADQSNLPGSRDEQHPNWRRRLPLNLDEWPTDERFNAIGETLRRERGSAVMPQVEDYQSPHQAIIPRATYRLQFNRDFTFAQAADLAPYLAELGISHVYASPYLRARPGSMHGYDIVDHSMLNPEIGSPQDYDNYYASLKANGLGQILDVVPNHMGIMGADNAWWLDVLENGPASVRGAFFDIDWEPLNPELHGKVLLPLLGDHYGTILERGELRLEFDVGNGEFSLFYHQHRLPIDPATYPRIVGFHGDQLLAMLGDDHVHHIELQALLTAFARLPARMNTAPKAMAERQRDKEVNKRHLAALCEACPDITRHIATNLEEFNGIPGESTSFDPLHDLIQLQGYRLAYWRVASDDINYRRFFDINDLAALRIEEPTVFDDTHRFVLDLLAQGKIEGLRIDHPDGLYDPGAYFRRLQEAAGGKALVGGDALPLYLVIEKILADHERLPDDWPIHGATGYRFANLGNALFVDNSAERRLTRIYESFTGTHDDFESLALEAKKTIMYTALSSELNVLATRLARIAAASRETCDFTLNGLRQALVEVVASFPVYRSYVTGHEISADDRRHIGWAVAVAKKHSPVASTGIFDFIHGVLTTDIARGRGKSYRQRVENFAMKFQQFSSPVMAKGVEDTAFYRYHRLTSLNDVGGEPRRFGISVAAFHSATRTRAARWPHNMLASSTHDSKRSEDVRARINVISEIPGVWKLMLKRWSRLNRGRKRVIDAVDGLEAPSRNDEYLLYQTLIGAWPLDLANDPGSEEALSAFGARIEGYMIKALREAKEHSSWANVNDEYESAMAGFIQAILAPGEKNLFLVEFVNMVQPIMYFGLLNSLAQTLIKLTSPGVPDVYQGCESWQFNLVDPDNRRPIDFERRRQQLAEIKQLVEGDPAQWREPLRPLLEHMADGRIKLYTVWQTLNLRSRWPEVFDDGDYLPITVLGEKAAHICAFARRTAERTLITVVPRLCARLLGSQQTLPVGPEVWGNTELELPDELAELTWYNALSGEQHSAAGRLAVAQVLGLFPVALLTAEHIPDRQDE